MQEFLRFGAGRAMKDRLQKFIYFIAQEEQATWQGSGFDLCVTKPYKIIPHLLSCPPGMSDHQRNIFNSLKCWHGYIPWQSQQQCCRGIVLSYLPHQVTEFRLPQGGQIL